MGKRKIAVRFVAICLGILLVAGIIPEEVCQAAITHGTTNRVITEDMLNNTPPVDYEIDMSTQGKAKDALYNAYFLKDDIQTVRIELPENNLNYLLQNAVDEPYVMTESVTIGDTTLGYCGLKTKGNYTLLHAFTDNPGSDRFSFTVNFGKYIKKADYGKKQDFYGCNKISFNNFFFDKTMMKEFFALMLMEKMGLPTPQFGLAKLYINGEYYGVYAMVEAFDESILEQYYGVDDDELSSYLVKPAGTNFVESSLAENMAPLWENDEDTKADVEDMLPTVIKWVKNLNKLHQGRNFDGQKIDVNSDEYVELLNQIYDVEEVVKYFAVHSWLCQMDNMFDSNQNFGLYVDANGRAMVLPWDYDLSFGCFYPSTAEATANFNIDVMWRNGLFGPTSSPDVFYKDFPLFNVIYQNKSLREKYHDYMKECSQIAALGGEVNGQIYEPGYFASYIETLEKELKAAASEKLAKNVYYMNFISQPNGVNAGLPNLSKIIAMRSVGVYTQVEGIKTTVSGAGCNLETLGNAIQGDTVKKGTITAVHDKLGIFVTGTYANNNRNAPQLSVSKIQEKDTYFQNILQSIGCKESELVIYSMKTSATPSGAHTVTIPVSPAKLKAGAVYTLYACAQDGAATKLDAEVDGNLYTVTTDTIRYIAVVEGDYTPVTGPVASRTPDWALPVVLVILGLVLAVGITVSILRRKSKK